MEMKFKVGDRVKDIRTGRSGEIKSLTYSGYDKAHCVWVEFGFIHNKKQTFTNKSYRIDGTELDKGVCLHHIDPPAPVLTEWQEKQLRIMADDCFEHRIVFHSSFMDRIKSILSEPEPPKYIPKHGDAIRLRDRESDPWLVDVFDKMINDGRDYLGFNMAGKYCIPFDLIGTTDNP